MGLKTKLSKRLKSFLTVSFTLLLGGCSCFPKDLNVEPKQILTRFNKCKVYRVVDFENLKFEFDRDITLDECIVDGDFILTSEEIQKIRRAAKEAKKCYEDTCQRGPQNGN
jgi:hypothetical protein